MIKIENLSKKFEKNKWVLKNLNFEIAKGEAIGILGANGSGKTTLIEIISGISEPTEGKVNFISENKEIDNKIKESIGIQFQKGDWPFNTRGVDLLNLLISKKWNKDEYIKELINIFEVEDILTKRLSDLSGGQQQRFNSMISIIKKPKILILDELITGLDLKMQIKLVNFFDNLRKKEDITLIVISHIPEEIEKICNRIIVLNKGEIYRDESVKKIIKEYGSIRYFLEKYYEEIDDEK
ncbi:MULTISPECIES: ABC transporter ATP-binding protein [unclassified Spiroplasma]|uniref:ABC transporter ATP-binding protein n=1 Tax=unclassified Spiroplasma TaxID=2637901 RepID=UPI0030D53245